MTYSDLKNNKKGFTIIEVLIVLAIAGLILLVVFLAVPALQRNSRNTQRRNDIAGILAGVNEYAANNRGSLPGDSTEFNDEVKPLFGVGFYEKDNVVYVHNSVPASQPTGTTDDVIVYSVARCHEPDNPNNIIGGGGNRSFAAVFWVEGGGNDPVQQCQAG